MVFKSAQDIPVVFDGKSELKGSILSQIKYSLPVNNHKATDAFEKKRYNIFGRIEDKRFRRIVYSKANSFVESVWVYSTVEEAYRRFDELSDCHCCSLPNH
jgi:hypothetical protein